ncbi:MAG: transposase [Alphaproteobacteria bacterium]|nr:transposase [Alphaproteobacteria bacterium]
MSAADVPRRRHWSDADKFRIVEESFVGHRQMTATARRHGISRSMLTVWRRQYRRGELGSEPSPVFIPVTLPDEAPAPTTRTPLPSNPEARTASGATAYPLDGYAFEGEQDGLVLEGEILLLLDDEQVILRKDDSFSYPSTIPHRFRNNGRSEAVMVWAMAPV